MVQYNLTLPSNSAIPVVSGIVLKQGDKGIKLNFRIEDLDTSTAVKAKFVFYRSNGTSVEYETTTVGTSMSYVIRGTELAVPGKTIMDIKFYDASNNRISTTSAIFEVAPDTLNGFEGSASSYSATLDQLVTDFRAAINNSGIATTATPGIVKPDGSSITVASDGTIHAVNTDVPKPNILDNPFFTVNQRGGKVVPSGVNYYQGSSTTVVGTTTQAYKVEYIDSYSNAIFKIGDTTYWTYSTNVVDGYVGAGYTVDRWKNVAGTTTSVVDGGLKLSTTNSTTGGVFLQYLDNYTVNSIVGKNITLSIVASTSSTICRVRIRFGAENNTYISELSTIIRNGVSSISGLVPNNAKNINVEIWENNTVTDLIVKCVKLELGSISTLANDVAPNYAEELTKCQRYYRKYNIEQYGTIGVYAQTTNTTIVPIDYGTMRTQPSLVSSVTLSCPSSSNPTESVTFTGVRIIGSTIRLIRTGTGLSMSSGICYAASPVSIEISADL